MTRAAVLLPFIVPTVLSTLAWLWMFDATFSVFNWVMRFLWQMEISLFGVVLKENWGFFSGPLWLGDPGWAMFSVILVNVWRGLPFFAISFLAALQTIPQELYDAADIDGATGWRKFWHVTLPMIKPVAIVVVVFSIVVTFADFQLVYVLTRGGPNNETHLLATLAYQLGMTSGNIGQGAAVAYSCCRSWPGDRVPALVSAPPGRALTKIRRETPDGTMIGETYLKRLTVFRIPLFRSSSPCCFRFLDVHHLDQARSGSTIHGCRRSWYANRP